MEHLTAWLLNIDLNAADDAYFDTGDRIHDILDVLLGDSVHGISQFGHRLLCLLNLMEVGLEGLPNVQVLVVEHVSVIWQDDFSFLIRLGLPIVLSEPLEGIDCSSTCIILMFLALALVLAEFAIWCDAYVRCEHDDQIATCRYM